MVKLLQSKKRIVSFMLVVAMCLTVAASLFVPSMTVEAAMQTAILPGELPPLPDGSDPFDSGHGFDWGYNGKDFTSGDDIYIFNAGVGDNYLTGSRKVLVHHTGDIGVFSIYYYIRETGYGEWYQYFISKEPVTFNTYVISMASSSDAVDWVFSIRNTYWTFNTDYGTIYGGGFSNKGQLGIGEPFYRGLYNLKTFFFDTQADYEKWAGEHGVFDEYIAEYKSAIYNEFAEHGSITIPNDDTGSGGGDFPFDDDYHDIDDEPDNFVGVVIYRLRWLYDALYNLPRRISSYIWSGDLGRTLLSISNRFVTFPIDIAMSLLDSDLGQFLIKFAQGQVNILNAILELDLAQILGGIYDLLIAFPINTAIAFLNSDLGEFIIGIPLSIINNFAERGLFGTLADISGYVLSLPLKFMEVFANSDLGQALIKAPLEIFDVLTQPLQDFIVFLFVPSNDLLSDHIDFMMEKFPFLESCRDMVDLVMRRLKDISDHGVVVPILHIPLSSTFLDRYGVEDYTINFDWFLPYRAGVLMLERAFLWVAFVFRFYFSVKSIFNATASASVPISYIANTIEYRW